MATQEDRSSKEVLGNGSQCTRDVSSTVDCTCQCHRFARVHELVTRSLEGTAAMGTFRSPIGSSDTATKRMRLIGPRPVLALGKGLAEALEARKEAMQIANSDPQHPVSVIANAAWSGAPELVGSHSLISMAPSVAERFGGTGAGSVISMLTFANSHVVDCGDAGLVMIDCGTAFTAPRIFDLLRQHTDKPLHSAIYTHGHADHIGVNYMAWEDESFRVIAHENVVRRFDRYRKTAGYNTFINKRQFQIPDNLPYAFPGTYDDDLRYPDLTYKTYLRFEVGGQVFELFAGKGETDDATIVWMPKQRYCFCGDFFIWNAPNAGNPQKVQRYPEEWAKAARKIIDLRPVIVFPGHGPPILGEERVREAFTNQARLLEGICSYTLDGINSGLSLTKLMANVPIPQQLLSLPYLQPRYDDPRWFVANLWRRYCGWYTMDVRHLLPVDVRDVGVELAKMVGGADKLAAQAEQLVRQGGPTKLGVALELAEFAAGAAGDSSGFEAAEAHRVRALILRALVNRETTLMAKSIYGAAAADSEKRLAKL